MVSEESLVKLALFLSAVFAAGQLGNIVKIPSILAYVISGALLGPPLAGFAPQPEGLKLAGLLGLQLSVIDAGLSTPLHDLRDLAVRATFIAIVGVVLPFAGAFAVVYIDATITQIIDGDRTVRTAFAVGAAVAPTSLGVTAALLNHVGEAQTRLGKLISVAAVVDDVISLILLAQVSALAETPTPWRLLQPLVFALAFIAASVVLAFLLPFLWKRAFQVVPIPTSAYPVVELWGMLIIASAMTYGAIRAGTSFLLAGYLAGVSFATVDENIAQQPWNIHVAPKISWPLRLFFAATVAFVLPVRTLFAPDALSLGVGLAVIAIVGKVLAGLVMLPNWLDALGVGVAMLGRGEFGFLIAAQSKSLGLISDRVYAATAWAIIVPTLLSPLIFIPVFRIRQKALGEPSTTITREHSQPEGSTPASEHVDNTQFLETATEQCTSKPPLESTVQRFHGETGQL